MDREIAEEVTPALLQWGSTRLRDLPWRRTNDSWRVFVSEVMLQQTSVARVLPKYDAFITRFPSPRSLAEAPLGEALALWHGLGYPRRCRNLQHAAQVIVSDHDGLMPATLDELLRLPGVGAYTARAVLAFARNEDVAVVDTNVARMLARVSGRPLKAKEAQAIADELVPMGQGWQWNQIVMDFGAQVCRARSPRCAECPLLSLCAYQGRPDRIDPAPATAGTSKPQAKFEGSNRQARGRALRAVTDRPLTRSETRAAMQLDNDESRADSLIDDLIAEGLIVEREGRLSVP